MGSGADQSDTSISLLMEKNTEPDKSWKFNLGCQSRRRCVSQRSERAVEVQQLLKDAEAVIGQTRKSVWRIFRSFLLKKHRTYCDKLKV